MKIRVTNKPPIEGLDNYKVGEQIRADLGAVDYLVLDEAINLIPLHQFENAIQYYCGLVAHQGEIVIQSYDLRSLAKAVINRQVDMSEFCSIVENSAAVYEISFLVEKLKSLGFDIEKKKLLNYSFIVKARRV